MLAKKIISLVFCHLVGDYVLQNAYIAETKGSNWYHLFVHCALYCLPFYVIFPSNSRLLILFISHFLIDMAKARFKLISYTADQWLHYTVIFACYLDPVFSKL